MRDGGYLDEAPQNLVVILIDPEHVSAVVGGVEVVCPGHVGARLRPLLLIVQEAPDEAARGHLLQRRPGLRAQAVLQHHRPAPQHIFPYKLFLTDVTSFSSNLRT